MNATRDENMSRQRARSLAIGFVLAGLALVFFAVTIVKLGGVR